MQASEASLKWRTLMKTVTTLHISRNARITEKLLDSQELLCSTDQLVVSLRRQNFLCTFYISWIKYIKFSSFTSLFYNFCTGAVSSLYCGRLAGLSGSFERTPPRTLDLWHPSSLLMQMAFTVGANYFTELLQIKSRCLSQRMDGTGLWERR